MLHSRDCVHVAPLAASLGHVPSMVTWPQGVPPKAAGVRTLRVRFMLPVPQLAVHGDHLDHAPNSQLMGQGCVLHGSTSVREPQDAPVPELKTSISRVRYVSPVPHILEQVPHEPHWDREQSMLHSKVPHATASVVAPHLLPPWAGCVVVRRVRIFFPGLVMVVITLRRSFFGLERLKLHGWQ